MQTNDIFFDTAGDIYNDKYCLQTDEEILTFMLSRLNLDKAVACWSEEILLNFDSLPMLFMASAQELQDKLSISEKDCVTVKLLYAIIKRVLYKEIYQCNIIKFKKNLIDYLIVTLSREYVEHFIIYFLDKENYILAEKYQGSGTVNTTSIYLREVARDAIQYQATSIILVHNHPSGNPQPSETDKYLTQQLSEALLNLNIIVKDHLIIGNGRYFSFQEKKLLTF